MPAEKKSRSASRAAEVLHDAEYSQANENLRFSFTMELAYFRFHTNSIVLLLVAYWFTIEIGLLRGFLAILGIIISLSGIVVEYRTIRYYRQFFEAILSLEKAYNLTQMSFLTQHVTAPPLNIRTSHMIYVLFTLSFLFWTGLLLADTLHYSAFIEMLSQLKKAKPN